MRLPHEGEITTCATSDLTILRTLAATRAVNVNGAIVSSPSRKRITAVGRVSMEEITTEFDLPALSRGRCGSRNGLISGETRDSVAIRKKSEPHPGSFGR
jgi:hypothetical protein